jgi:hypothetical protein
MGVSHIAANLGREPDQMDFVYDVYRVRFSLIGVTNL